MHPRRKFDSRIAEFLSVTMEFAPLTISVVPLNAGKVNR
jgi:hypothetical protein